MPNQITADYVDGSHDQIVEITICINADNITAGSTLSFHCVRSLPPPSSRASSCQEFQSLVSQPQRGWNPRQEATSPGYRSQPRLFPRLALIYFRSSCWLLKWLVGWRRESVGWLVTLLIGRLDGRLVGWWIGFWLFRWFWLDCMLIYWFLSWLVGLLVNWLIRLLVLVGWSHGRAYLVARFFR